MPTIKDIAAAAGVSVGTVSNVINGSQTVSQERARKVNEAIRALGYAPNSTARTLKTRVSKTVGLILPDITNPFYAELARGAEDMLGQHGYTLFLCNKDRSTDKEYEYLTALSRKDVDGVILVKPALSPGQLKSFGQQYQLALIDMEPGEGLPYAIINVDDEAGGRLMTEYLYQMGHRRIAYFIGNTSARSDILRLKGYEGFMREKGLWDERLLVPCQRYSAEAGYTRTLDMLAGGPMPEAIFAANDMLAIGVIQALNDRGLRVPEDLSVAGCDDITLSRYMHPALTTITRPKYELGQAGAAVLIDILQGRREGGPSAQTLASRLVVRNSVGKKPDVFRDIGADVASGRPCSGIRRE